MVEVNCPECGEQFRVDAYLRGDTSCPNCTEPLEVSMGENGIEVRRKRPFIPASDIPDNVKNELEPVEWNSLQEASLCAAEGAYIGAEFMSTRALESISRRVTGEGNWPNAIDALEDDYPDLTPTIEYLKSERNKVAHPDKVESSKTEAQQTYHMTVRMITEMFGN